MTRRRGHAAGSNPNRAVRGRKHSARGERPGTSNEPTWQHPSECPRCVLYRPNLRRTLFTALAVEDAPEVTCGGSRTRREASRCDGESRRDGPEHNDLSHYQLSADGYGLNVEAICVGLRLDSLPVPGVRFALQAHKRQSWEHRVEPFLSLSEGRRVAHSEYDPSQSRAPPNLGYRYVR